jgi:hypothetical protein
MGLLAACNLQQVPPTATLADPQTVASPAPADALPITPTLRPTPTQIFLVTTTPDSAPTPLNFGTGQPTQDAAQFNERYEVNVRDDTPIAVIYDITITRGSLLMLLQGPDGVVWEQSFTATEAGRAEVTITQGGTYEILVRRENFDGNYSVSWE